MGSTGHFRGAVRVTIAYRILGSVMLGLTAGLGVLWVLPKGDGGLWGLLCIVPALAVLLGILTTTVDIDEPMLTKHFFGWGAAMACG
ncbi:MAG: hypothetical protein L0G99_05085 [Propionibacteriales bacterium]|nr:hypothetical protein [Propionibacteriales bacterium]